MLGGGWKQRRDGWRCPAGSADFSEKLHVSLQSDLPGWHVGIICSEQRPEMSKWYQEEVRVPLSRVTFATIFVAANYPRFLDLNLDGTFLVGSMDAADYRVPKNVFADDNWDYRRVAQDLAKTVSRPILVAFGPMANVLIHEYWRVADAPQVIVDIGSVLDPKLKGKRTRKYHRRGSPQSTQVFGWQDFRTNANSD